MMAEGLSPSRPGVGRFPTTRLSLVLAAGGPDRQAQDALAALCRIYWYPLYAYVRRHGYSADEAQDLTQGFIARLLEKKILRDFQPERGRFRSFLLASLKHFLANERASAHALKRGGGVSPVRLDLAMDSGEHRYRMEPRDDLTPEKIFEKQWALALVSQVIARLREEFERTGKSVQFNRLQGCLTGDDNDRCIRYRKLAQELDMTEGALKVAIHRLRHRFREALRDEISATVVHTDEIGEEIRYLMAVIRT
jgi:RNA polymerase sigma factor (sigma-70 family)